MQKAEQGVVGLVLAHPVQIDDGVDGAGAATERLKGLAVEGASERQKRGLGRR